jgi:hypothetical protein
VIRSSEPLLPLATLPRDGRNSHGCRLLQPSSIRHRDAIYVSALPLAELLFIMNDSRSSPLRAIHITKISPPVIIPVRSASGTGRLQLERLSATEMWPGVWRQDRATRRWCRFVNQHGGRVSLSFHSRMITFRLAGTVSLALMWERQEWRSRGRTCRPLAS